MDEDRARRDQRDLNEKAAERRSELLGFRYFDMRPIENSLPLHHEILSIKEMRDNHIIPLSIGEGRAPFQFGVTSLTPQSFLALLKKQYEDKGQAVRFLLVSEDGFRTVMLRYDPPKEVEYDDIQIAKAGDSETIDEVSKTLASVRPDELFDFLITQAERLGASDIHIENMRDKIRIRMRVDGALHPVANIERDRYRIIIGELSSRASMSAASTKPQSGNMRMEIQKDDGPFLLNLRVEMVPTMYGMDSVLRLFNFDQSFLNLDLLGLGEQERAEIDEIISHPRGLVLVVGPTGSGKSTTLYSMINALNASDRKIITLEDPVEYSVTGITQIPINTGDGGNFADGLRSVLRLDPDVVMVGEIRDVDTARTAIQASITGHLVLATFHADSTAAAFVRLIDMIGVNPIFASAVRLVMAQRLVRQLDDNKQAYEPSEAERNWILRQLENVSDEIKKPLIDDMKLYKPVPSKASPFGYKGRTVVMEQLVVNENIQKIIDGEVRDVNTRDIEEEARKSGMLTLVEKATIMALEGKTTLSEINRVI